MNDRWIRKGNVWWNMNDRLIMKGNVWWNINDRWIRRGNVGEIWMIDELWKVM